MHRIYFIVFFIFLFSCANDSSNHEHEIKDTDPVNKITELILQDITNDSLYVERSKINIERGQFEESLKDLEQAIILDSTNGQAHYLIADVLLELAKKGEGDRESLILSSSHFELAIKYQFEPSFSYKKAGEIYLYFEDFNHAIDLLNLSLDIDGTDFHTFILLGYCYSSLNDIENAIINFKKSIDINADNEEAYLQLGNLFFSKQDSTAIIYYQHAISINTENRNAYYNLGLTYHSMGYEYFSNAQDAYHAIIDLSIQDDIYVDAVHNLGFMFLEDLKDYRNAINYFVEAIRVNPLHYQSLCRLAICYQSLGDVINAEKYYKESLEINPEYDIAKENLEQLLLDNNKYN